MFEILEEIYRCGEISDKNVNFIRSIALRSRFIESRSQSSTAYELKNKPKRYFMLLKCTQ